jgi:hypothetical protein
MLSVLLGGCSFFPEDALDYVPKWWVGELHVVHDAHLFILQIHACSFGTIEEGEMALLLSMWCGIERLSIG